MFIILKQLETSLRALKQYVDKHMPKKISDLPNDANFITSESIPTNVSNLNNDTGFITINDLDIATNTDILQTLYETEFIPDPNIIGYINVGTATVS